MRLHPTHGMVILAFGEVIYDTVVLPRRPLFYGGGHVDGGITFYRGGCAANVAAGCAQLGAPARFLGHVGADPLGDRLLAQLDQAGVDIIAIRRGETACSLSIAEPDGETALVFSPGGSRSMSAADMRAEHMTGVAIVHLNSHHLYSDSTRDAFAQVVGHAQDADAFISLDVSAANRLIDYGPARYRDDLQAIRPDVLFANQQEAEMLSLFDAFPEGVGLVMVHRGAKSTLCISSDGWWKGFDVPPVKEVIDTTGGGDAFAAGYLSAILRKSELAEAVESAHALAAATICHAGVEFTVEHTGSKAR